MSEAPPELAAFCHREYPRLVGALGLYCGDRHLAEDLAQEAIVRVCADWQRVSGMASPSGWTHRVAINLANSHYRRRGLHRRMTHLVAAADHDDGPDVGQRVDVLRALGTLRPRYRTVLILRHYLGHSTAETAHLMSIPEGTVKSLLSRALEQLRTSAVLRETELKAGRR